MLTTLVVIFGIVAVRGSADNAANNNVTKRGVAGVSGPWTGLNLDPWNNEHQGVELQPRWNPQIAVVANPLWSPEPVDLTLGQVQLQAVHNLALQALSEHHRPGTASIAYSPEVLRAIQFAKEANYHVQLAQHRVADAKQAAIVQQRFALAKEAAAREAAQRSAEITANAEAEARSSARQLVAQQQRLAALKDALAAAQRVAAARESAAAAAIQKTAQDTAAELRKQDVDRQISQSESEARAKHVVAEKENIISHGLQNNNGAHHKQHNPWG